MFLFHTFSNCQLVMNFVWIMIFCEKEYWRLTRIMNMITWNFIDFILPVIFNFHVAYRSIEHNTLLNWCWWCRHIWWRIIHAPNIDPTKNNKGTYGANISSLNNHIHCLKKGVTPNPVENIKDGVKSIWLRFEHTIFIKNDGIN